MNAKMLNQILAGLIVLLIGAAGASFYFGSQALQATVLETAHAQTDYEIQEQNIAQLARLESQMKDKEAIAKRAQQIAAEGTQYQYQDQIVQDVNTFAARAGVQVLGYSFSSDSPAVAPDTATPAISGIKTINASINLAAPVSYDNFIKFLMAIEQNLTKIQVTGIDMTPDNKDINAISNPTVTIQVYVKA